MSGKRVKQLRRQVKEALGVKDVNAKYGQHITERILGEGVDVRGKTVDIKSFTLVSTLTEQCPRKVYQQFKKQVKISNTGEV